MAEKKEFDALQYIIDRIKYYQQTDDPYTHDELLWIRDVLIGHVLHHGKMKAGGKVMVPIYMEMIKTWKYRKGKVGEVVC